MIQIKILSEADFQNSIWSGGKTRQLFIFPETGDYQSRQFDYRLSTATVELAQSEFSDLSGYHRLIMSLDKPIKLSLKDQQAEKLLRVFESYYFEGNEKIISRGECTDYNLIYNNNYVGQMMAIARNNDPICENNPIQFIYALNDLHFQIENMCEGILQANHLLIVEKNSTNNSIKINLSPYQEVGQMIAVWAGLSDRDGLSLHD